MTITPEMEVRRGIRVGTGASADDTPDGLRPSGAVRDRKGTLMKITLPMAQRRLNDLLEAADTYAMKGSYDPERRAVAEAEYIAARSAMHALLVILIANQKDPRK